MPSYDGVEENVLEESNLSPDDYGRPRPGEPVADDRFSDWIAFLAAVRGLATSTLERYALAVRRYLDFVGSGAVDRGSIERYLKTRRLARLGDSAIRQELAAIRSFSEWAAGNGVLPLNPSLGIKGPRSYRREAACFTVAEVQRLLLGGVTRDAASVTGWGARDLRNRVLLALCYFAGLRASEPGQLLASDVVYEVGTGLYSILVRRGKWSSADQRIELEAVSSRLLGAYLPLRAQVTTVASPWLLPSWRGTPLDRSSVLRIFRQRMADVGIQAKGRKLSPHSLRHSIATHLLADDRFELRQVQEHLRHADVRTTMRYVHTTTARARRAWQARHPWKDVPESANLAREALAAVRGLGHGDAP